LVLPLENFLDNKEYDNIIAALKEAGA